MTTDPMTTGRAAPRYAVNATSLPHTTVWQDIEVIATAGQVCDVRDPERSSFDRELPGRGRATAPGIMASLLTAGYRGWWELEIFSDDGTFGTALPGSYWAMPPTGFLTQARAAFDSSYALATARAGVAGR